MQSVRQRKSLEYKSNEIAVAGSHMMLVECNSAQIAPVVGQMWWTGGRLFYTGRAKKSKTLRKNSISLEL